MTWDLEKRSRSVAGVGQVGHDPVKQGESRSEGGLASGGGWPAERAEPANAEWARLADAEGGPVSAKRAVELAAEPGPPPDGEPDDWTDEQELERALGALRDPGLYGLAAGYLHGWSPALRRRADEIARELLAAELEILRRDDRDHERRAVLERVGRVIRDRVREEAAA